MFTFDKTKATEVKPTKTVFSTWFCSGVGKGYGPPQCLGTHTTPDEGPAFDRGPGHYLVVRGSRFSDVPEDIVYQLFRHNVPPPLWAQ